MVLIPTQASFELKGLLKLISIMKGAWIQMMLRKQSEKWQRYLCLEKVMITISSSCSGNWITSAPVSDTDLPFSIIWNVDWSTEPGEYTSFWVITTFALVASRSRLFCLPNSFSVCVFVFFSPFYSSYLSVAQGYFFRCPRLQLNYWPTPLHVEEIRLFMKLVPNLFEFCVTVNFLSFSGRYLSYHYTG